MDFSPFDDPTGAFFGGLTLILGTIILVTAMIKTLDFLKARVTAKATATSEQDYRRLAQQATRSHEQVAEQLKRLESIDTRLAEVERLLREVDEPALASR